MSTKAVIGATPGKPVRFSYVNLFAPRKNDKNGNMEYSVTLLIPKTNTEDVEKIRKAIGAEMSATFTAKGKKSGPLVWNPLRDGDTDVKPTNGESYGPEAKGCYILSAKTNADKGQPGIVDAKLQKIFDSKELTSGDWGAASVNLSGYDTGNGGVGCYINNVQKLKPGEPLSSTSRAEDDFTAVTEDFLS